MAVNFKSDGTLLHKQECSLNRKVNIFSYCIYHALKATCFDILFGHLQVSFVKCKKKKQTLGAVSITFSLHKARS